MRIGACCAFAIFFPLSFFSPYVCAISFATDGKVTYGDTETPIPGAFVIALWDQVGTDGFGSRSSCQRVSIVQSDENGRFRIPANWEFSSIFSSKSLYAYKAGYERFSGRVEYDRESSLRLVPVTVPPLKRLDYFSLYSYIRKCVHSDNDARQLRALYREIANELTEIRVPEASQAQVDHMIRAYRSLGSEPK